MYQERNKQMKTILIIQRFFKREWEDFTIEASLLKSDLIRWFNANVRKSRDLDRYEEFDEHIERLSLLKQLRQGALIR